MPSPVPPRCLSLLSTGLAQIKEENRSNTATPPPHSLDFTNKANNSTDTTLDRHDTSNSESRQSSIDTSGSNMFNPVQNFELIPDQHTLNRLRRAHQDNNAASPDQPSTPREENSRPNTHDRLINYGDEILPDDSSALYTPEASPEAAHSSLAITPIRHDSHASRLRKGHTSLRLQDSAKVLKLTDPGKYRTLKTSKIHRALSESETNKFDPIHGKRFTHDDKHRPFRINRYQGTESPTDETKGAWSYSTFNQLMSDKQKDFERTDKYGVLDGLNDEYLPDLDFSEALHRWDSTQYSFLNDKNTSLDSSLIGSSITSSADVTASSTPLGQTHAMVSPLSVPASAPPRRTMEEEEAYIYSQLPEDFFSLRFTQRRSAIEAVSPDANPILLRKIEKEAARNKSRSSLASQYINSLGTSRSVKSYGEGNVVLGHKLGRVIGSGAWGLIRECHNAMPNPGEGPKAMKIIRTKNKVVRDHFRREAAIWRRLDHDNILPLLGVKETDDAIFCLMNKADGGNFFDLVKKWGTYNSPQQKTPRERRLKIIKDYILQVIAGLDHMHSKGIVHGDIKLENCLIDLTPPKKTVLLCDFGMSHQFKVINEGDDVMLLPGRVIRRRPSIPRSLSGDKLKPTRSIVRIVTDRNKVHDDTLLDISMNSADSSESDILSFNATPIESRERPDLCLQLDPNIPDSHIGSLPYAAPELLELHPPPLGPTADIWALGVLFYTMCVGKLPFNHEYEPRLRAMIEKGDFDLNAFLEATDHNPIFLSVLEGCLERDMTRRSTLEEITHLLNTASF